MYMRGTGDFLLLQETVSDTVHLYVIQIYRVEYPDIACLQPKFLFCTISLPPLQVFRIPVGS